MNRAYIKRGLETYLPMEVRSYRPSKHTKRRVCTEVPLIPRVLFAALPSEAPALARHRYVTGLQRDVAGELVTIPAAQMAQFTECHQKWLEEAFRKAKGGELGGRRTKRKAKWRTASPAVLNEIMRDLFGVDDTAMDSMEAA